TRHDLRAGAGAAAASVLATAAACTAAGAGRLSGQGRVASRRDVTAAAEPSPDFQSTCRSSSGFGAEPAGRRAGDPRGYLFPGVREHAGAGNAAAEYVTSGSGAGPHFADRGRRSL